MPSWDSTPNYQAQLQQGMNNLAPLAPTWNGAQTGVPISQNIKQSSVSQGVLPAFWSKVTSVASQTANLGGEAAKWIGTQFVNTGKDIVGYAQGLGNALSDVQTSDNLNKQVQQLSAQQNNLIASYKSGQITKQDYLKGLQDLSQANMDLNGRIQDFMSQNSLEQKNFTKAFIGTEVAVASLIAGGAADGILGGIAEKLGAGLGSTGIMEGVSAAVDTLSKAQGLARVANVIDTLANSEEAWSGTSPLAQMVMREATNTALQGAGQMATAGQIVRAAAADILFKYPLYFNAMDGQTNQIMNDLNQNKYGDAVKTFAFNAALLFSGGPIGWGLKQAGKLGDSALVSLGLRPGSILDELSSQVGNGDRLALGKIAQEQIRSGNEADVRAMIVGLESNLKAAGGNSALAVNKIIDHLQNYIGWGDMKGMTHQELWDNMVNYWKHSEGLQQLKSDGKIAGMAADDPRMVVPGRFSTQDKNGIAQAVTKGDLAGGQTVQDRLAAWEAYKAANPNAAFANNPNVDKQVTNLIKTIDNPTDLHTAINSIPTQIGLDGIPKDYAAQMAKDGYIAIIPTAHNLPVVPFEQTTQKLVTGADTLSHRGGINASSWFMSAPKPIPVLQSVGNFLTFAGLSPEMASQTVNQVFTQNFTKAASQFGFVGLQGDTAEQTGQRVLNVLYDYMKAPTGGFKAFGHYLPITDMRQLTTNDIVRAFEKAGQTISKEQASQIGDAIMQAHLDVPREITGLGNKIFDKTYKINPITGIYSKIQQAGHFAWNPMFTQVRLPLKAEFLAQMETGGKFPTIAGTNRFMSVFFPGQYKDLNAIIDNPDFKQIIGSGLGGESESAATGIASIASNEVIPKSTQLPLAGLIKVMADRAGVDTATFLQQYPQQAKDAAQALLHYDKNNSFLNSPLAKTLNMAFFPFRFNVKVSGYMARFLASQPPAIQYAAVMGVLRGQDFLKSPQGQAWYAQHSDAIGFFKYISPLETLSTISNVLTHPGTISAYGELGGLPFGWIPTLSDSLGMTHFGEVYVNPKSGAIAKDYVPTNAYGDISAALQDLLGSLFSYPGAEVGLPSKGTVVRRVVNGILPNNSKSFTATTPSNISPQDQQFSQIAQQANSGVAPTSTQSTPNSFTPTQTITVPPQKSPQSTPLPTRSGTRKMKKSDYKPYLLPGQSKLGQL